MGMKSWKDDNFVEGKNDEARGVVDEDDNVNKENGASESEVDKDDAGDDNDNGNGYF